jgi:pimeloyl-ACP methyl ester carboxylesterase
VPAGQIYYEVAGDGPPVVLVHAGIADLHMWDEQMPALAPYTVVRYDCRGYGRSQSEPGAFSNRDDLAAVMDHLGITRAALVGCSRGGIIALDFTVERPERVTALIWVCGGISGWQPPDELFHPDEVVLWKAAEAAEAARDYERVAALDVRVWVDGPLQPEGRAAAHVRQKVYAMALNNYTTAMVEGLEPQPLDPPAMGRLGTVQTPVLAIVGDLDPSETAAAAEVLANAVADCRVAHFADCAHLPNMEQPERFNALLLGFLQGR